MYWTIFLLFFLFFNKFHVANNINFLFMTNMDNKNYMYDKKLFFIQPIEDH